MAAPARSEIPNRSNVLTAAKTFVTTGSPPNRHSCCHGIRHGDTGLRSVTTAAFGVKLSAGAINSLWLCLKHDKEIGEVSVVEAERLCESLNLRYISKMEGAATNKTDSSNLQIDQQGPKHEKPMDCAELMENGVNESGVYTIYPRSRLSRCKSMDVYCDMQTDGGGWTVIQRRGQYGNGEDYFVKRWKEYKEGFGNMNKEFWLGNDNIHVITNQEHYSVRMDMTNESGKSAFTRYENFWIENEEAKYKLHISDGSGPGGDAISNHDGYAFYAVDQANHADDVKSTRSGGWWRNNKKTSSLNGLNLYKTNKVVSEDGINWDTFGGFKTSLKATEIKVRHKNFQGSPENVTKP
ncbi:Techylectin-5A [Araneus ventricosus]|uniref:Techylectin-5A n=1 Tax=Araneus ventricosus TaxID=182803 RepID=A0A4Y2B3V4_ARAVE|nr:Techylectin-5A [Araneus ventricosus]